MKFRMVFVVAGVLTVLTPTAVVMAQNTTSCRAPSPPTSRPRRPSEVRLPSCLQFGNGADCESDDIDDYNRDVARFNGQLQSYQNAIRTYANELNEYVRNAAAYRDCEIDVLNGR